MQDRISAQVVKFRFNCFLITTNLRKTQLKKITTTISTITTTIVKHFMDVLELRRVQQHELNEILLINLRTALFRRREISATKTSKFRPGTVPTIRTFAKQNLTFRFKKSTSSRGICTNWWCHQTRNTYAQRSKSS